MEHASVLLCLGLDYKAGGFVDRALEAFSEVLRLDPGNEYALANLEKLYQEQHLWNEAYTTRQKLAAAAPDTQRPRHQQILSFLEDELGREALKRMDYAEATRHFSAAIELDAKSTPAYLSLGDVLFYQGRTADAIAAVGTPRRDGFGSRLPCVRTAGVRIRRSGGVSASRSCAAS